MVKYFIKILFEAAENEYDSDIINAQMHAMKDCIDEIGTFLGLEEINQLTQKIISILEDSHKRKQGVDELGKEEDIEDDEKDLLEFDKKTEEELHVTIAELIGILFKTHPDLTVDFANNIYNKVLPNVLGAEVSNILHKFGIFLIDDMVEYLGHQRLGDKWPHFAEALCKFATAKICFVR